MTNSSNSTRVIYLARWYPNRYDPMPGLFIQRHAEAANSFCEVGVVYTHVVENETIKGFETELNNINGVFTAKVYYSNSKLNIPLISPMIKALKFIRANNKGIKMIKDELGGFDLLHVHVLTRLGLIALWYKWFRKKPYVISEHWSRYLPLTGDFKGPLKKWLTKLVVRNASVVTTVTENLATAMKSHDLKNENYRVLANVVTDDFFNHTKTKGRDGAKTIFLHVSCFEDKSKNISGMLRVIKSLSLQRDDFHFVMVGDGMDFKKMKAYTRKLGISRKVLTFTGLLEGEELVKQMSSADVLVIFSNYENFPVVINEGFSLGIPVLSTRVGGIPEYVKKYNGRLIDPGDEAGLEHEMKNYLDGKLKFNPQSIRTEARSLFTARAIGKELCEIYHNLVK